MLGIFSHHFQPYFFETGSLTDLESVNTAKLADQCHPPASSPQSWHYRHVLPHPDNLCALGE